MFAHMIFITFFCFWFWFCVQLSRRIRRHQHRNSKRCETFRFYFRPSFNMGTDDVVSVCVNACIDRLEVIVFGSD